MRGSVGRAKLQQERLLRPGDPVKYAASSGPNGSDAPRPSGAHAVPGKAKRFASQQTLRLIAWQVAQALDLYEANQPEGVKDTLSLLLLMLDQCAQDRGDPTLGWLLTLQADPPLGLFQQPSTLPGSSLQSISPLADQRWVTVALAYTKELETIASGGFVLPAVPGLSPPVCSLAMAVKALAVAFFG